MDTRGTFAPESATEATERFERLGSTAQVLVRELARAMDFDAGEYDERVTADVVATAREVLFAEQLQVSVGSREEFEDFRAATDAEVEVIGTETVDNVAWHAPPFSEVAVAATFQEEADAAVGTLRRQALGRVYESVI